MVCYYLYCEKCKEKLFLGQGYGIIQVRGSNPKTTSKFINDHYFHSIVIYDENDMEDIELKLDEKGEEVTEIE